MKRTIVFFSPLLLFFAISTLPADEVKVKLAYEFMDGTKSEQNVALEQRGSVLHLVIPKESVPENIKYLSVYHPDATAEVGDDGFYVFCDGMYGRFKQREEGTYRNVAVVMPMFGVKTPRAAMTVIVTGMRYEAHQLVELKNGRYDVFPRYALNGDKAYDDIRIEYHYLDKDNATYSDMAKVYRKFQVERKLVRPLRERVKNSPELEYAAGAMSVRIRMGWKPMPTTVEEQTEENEPSMKVAVSFDRFKQIVDEFKRQGVGKAEFCLVGWNVSGHDGRFPQLFPVEERLGGEVKLREAIKKAQQEGYRVVCHTCNYDAYSVSRIAGLWDEGYVMRAKNGTLIRQKKPLSGGVAYLTCPKCMYERFAQSDHRKTRELGFRGLHYIDVYSIVNPYTCYSTDHPLTKDGYAEWVRKILGDAQTVFGGVASEGGFDHCLPYLDYALYISIAYDPDKPLPPLVDRYVPIWQLVYNGYILHTPFSRATNYTIKSPVTQLKMIEFAGRPLYYFYSNYRDGNLAWMGVEDLRCDTDEELAESVKAIKAGYVEFEKLKHLQFEFMESHDEIDKNVFKTTFSDGTSIVVNYRDTYYEYEGNRIQALKYIVLR